MNERMTYSPDELARLLDRLVDGELGDAERRQLLSTLDQFPEGWRRCALAFLEEQSFRDGLAGAGLADLSLPGTSAGPGVSASAGPARSNVGGEVAAAGRQEQGGSPAAPSLTPASASSALSAQQSHAPKPTRYWPGMFAIAASFAVAFALGIVLRDTLNPRGNVGGDFALDANPPSPISPKESYANQTPPSLPPRRAGLGRDGIGRDNVTLVVNGNDGQSKRVDAPLLDLQEAGDDLPWNAAPVIPSDIEEQLEAMGHQVVKQRRYAPVRLEDGRRMLVPVEDVEIRPMGRKSY